MPTARRAAPLALALALCSCDSADSRPIPAALEPSARESHRKLPMDGADNFRDLGGYRAADGRSVRWGLLYRSDALNELSDDDLAYMRRLGIRRIVDFRSDAERDEAPSRVPETAAVTALPVSVAGADRDGASLRETLAQPGAVDAIDFGEYLVAANRDFVEEHRAAWRQWLLELAEEPDAPMVFHCTAGKDRTGFAAAILLSALGVPRETVIADYLLSTPYTAEKTERQLRTIRWASLFRIDAEKLRPLLVARRSYIEAAFDALESRYGSVERYLSDGLGIGDDILARLKDRLLEP